MYKYLGRLIWLFLITVSLISCKTSNEVLDEKYKDDAAKSILFIGNSLTGFYEAQNKFCELAKNDGRQIILGDRIVNGTGLDLHCEDESTIETIRSRKWDYVVLQGSDYKIALLSMHDQVAGPIQKLVDIIRKNNPETKIIFFLDYALMPGVGKYPFDDFQMMLYSGTMKMAERFNMIVAPVGMAWKKVVELAPEINLYDKDGSHPSRYGAYLSACVYWSLIKKEKISENRYCSDLPASTALLLRKITSDIVIDDLEIWYKYYKTN